MTDDELKRRLQALVVPSVHEAARARARHRASLALRQDPTEEDPSTNSWLFAVGSALLLVFGFTLAMSTTQPTAIAEDFTRDRTILQQVQTLFPDQVEAVTEEDGKLDLSIADSPVVGKQQPVVLVFRRGGKTIRVLSYSGHEFCLPLDGAKRCFEVLATPTGSVIIEAKNEAWVATGPVKVAGFTVHAQTLERAL